MDFLLYVTIWVAGSSLLTLVVTAYDKRQAGRRQSRIPENTLIGLALVGGSPGLIIGMLAFRHKTRKLSFQVKVALVVAIQLAVAIVILQIGRA